MHRSRLATQIGSKLTGVLYVLYEPSIGLHPWDTEMLINTLKDLRDFGNTVIVVEHDPETIISADWVIDMGPGAGKVYIAEKELQLSELHRINFFDYKVEDIREKGKHIYVILRSEGRYEV